MVSAAVLNFQTSDAALASKGSETALLLSTYLSAAPNLMMVERQELDKALGEQELGMSGTVSPETAAQVGKLTGAKVLISGRLFGVGGKFFLVAKIMSTETSRVYGETVNFQDMGALDKAIEELAPKIQTLIEKRADTLLAKVEDPAARLDRLKKLVAGKKLPSVSVVIPEQHITRPVIDPAAQTEMLKVLQDIGFEIVDPQTGKQADVAITGEAFSEAAGRRGNFISCRARVEIKAIKREGGKLLLADRQNDVSVDTAESVGSKVALQNAALKLVDRIIPKLIVQ